MRPAIALAAIALGAAGAPPARADPPERVNEVSSVGIRTTGHRTLTVCARGTVLTGGYTRPTLKPARSSKGGVYDLDFTAVRPAGLATQMVSEISATFTWRNYPAGLKGVRVRGERGAVTALLGSVGGCG